jgi:hypothetical protein
MSRSVVWCKMEQVHSNMKHKKQGKKKRFKASRMGCSDVTLAFGFDAATIFSE